MAKFSSAVNPAGGVKEMPEGMLSSTAMLKRRSGAVVVSAAVGVTLWPSAPVQPSAAVNPAYS